MKIIKASEARSEFQDIIDTVHYREEEIVISKRGKPWVVIRALTENEKQKLSEQAQSEKIL